MRDAGYSPEEIAQAKCVYDQMQAQADSFLLVGTSQASPTPPASVATAAEPSPANKLKGRGNGRWRGAPTHLLFGRWACSR